MTQRAPTVIAALAAALLVSACSPPMSEATGILPALQFVTTDGSPLGPEQLKGKPVLINFWSRSCAVCMREMPLLQTVHERHQAAGLRVIAIAMPYDRPSDAVELKQVNQWTFDVAIDPNGATEKAFGGIKATPTSLLFDANGRQVWRRVGELDAIELSKQIAGLLQPNAAGSAR